MAGSTDIGGIHYEVDSKTDRLLQASRDVDRSTKKMEKDFGRVDRGVRGLTDSLGSLRAIAAGVGSALAVQKVVAYADAWTNLQNQLRQVTDTQTDLNRVTGSVLGIANETRSSVDATANLYARLTRASSELGLSEQRRLRITRTINQSFAVSGATAEEASAAITQLSQGLASGALRGDEFNSVAEQAPGIMRAIADEANMTIGELRAFAATGGITADLVVRALEGAADTMDQEFSKAAASFGQQMTVARNNMTAMVGDLDGLQGAIGTTGGVIVSASELLRDYSGEIDLVLGSMAGAIALYGSYRAALLLATAAQAAFNAVARANPYVAAATAIAAVVGALYSLRNATMSVQDTTAKVKDFIVAAWELTAEEIIEAWNQISQPLADGIRWVADVFGAESDDIGGFFGDAMGSVMSYAKLAVNTVIGLFRGLAGAVEVVVQSIADNFKNLWTNVGDATASALDLDFSAARRALERDLIDPMEVGVKMANRLKKELSTDYVGNFVDSLTSRVAANTLPLQSLDDWFLKAPSKAPTAPTLGTGNGTGKSDSDKSDQVDPLKALLKLQNDYNDLVARQRTDEESSLATLKERLALIDRAEEAGVGTDHDDQRRRAVSDALDSNPDQLTGGEYDNQFGRYQQDLDAEQERYDKQMAMLVAAREEQALTQQDYDRREEDFAQQHADRMMQIEQARQSLMLSTTSDLFAQLADASQAFAGEQSGIYRAMFAASKAFAIADAAIKIQQGIANAAALPFPVNLGAMATVAGATASIVSTIASTQIAGGRQYGGSVNAGSMYRVNEDGKPELLEQGGRQYLLPGRSGEVISNRDMIGAQSYLSPRSSASAGRSGVSMSHQTNVTFQITGNPDESTLEQMRQMSEQAAEEGASRAYNRLALEIEENSGIGQRINGGH